MKVVKLEPIDYKGLKHIAIRFERDNHLAEIIKKEGAKWSRTLGCWHVSRNYDIQNRLFNALKPHVDFVDYSSLSMPKKPTQRSKKDVQVNRIKKKVSPEITKALIAFEKHLYAKNYSKSTVDGYAHFVAL